MSATYDSTTYGEHWARFYDLVESPSLDTEGAVQRLAELADGGTVLELGVGTGRIALPLAKRGLAVHGVEASPAMLEVLREQPGAGALTLIPGDFATVELPSKYALAVFAYNTFSSLQTQEAQIACLQHIAGSLTPDAALVIELAVPDMARLAKGQDVSVRYVDTDLLVVHAAQYDVVAQRAIGQTTLTSRGVTRMFPVQIRYVWPSELDAMARLAGLRLEARWGDWKHSEFGPASSGHVSVYRRSQR